MCFYYVNVLKTTAHLDVLRPRGQQSLWPTLTKITILNNIRNLLSNFLLFEQFKIT